MAASLRRRARLRVKEPPSEAVQRLGLQLSEEYCGKGIRGCSVTGDPVVRIAKESYAPRRELTIAHELLELALPRHFRRGPLRERLCQRGAAALMLPSIAFERAIFLAEWDLAKLRRWHSWVSWEALGRRAADLFPGVTLTTWTEKGYRRSDSTEVHDGEAEAAKEAYRVGWARLEHGGMVVRAWSLPKQEREHGERFRLYTLAVRRPQ